jgi:hypothetical protein
MTTRTELTEQGREELLKRWLRLMVERSSLEELSSRPLNERIKELDLLLEAAGEAGIEIARGKEAVTPPERVAAPAPAGNGGLAGELGQRLAEHRTSGAAFSVALLAGNEDWRHSLGRAADGETVFEGPRGTIALVLPGLAGGDARAAVDRLRVAAWRELGSEGRLAEVSVASCPADGESAEALLGVAQSGLERLTSQDREERLERALAEHHERVAAGAGEPAAANAGGREASVTPLPLPDTRVQPQWGPWGPRS